MTSKDGGGGGGGVAVVVMVMVPFLCVSTNPSVCAFIFERYLACLYVLYATTYVKCSIAYLSLCLLACLFSKCVGFSKCPFAC